MSKNVLLQESKRKKKLNYAIKSLTGDEVGQSGDTGVKDNIP